jgi:hypothetical protein
MTQWFYILTGGSIGSHQLLSVDVPTDLGTNDSGLNGATIYMMEADSEYVQYSLPVPGQMWQLTVDGTIVSALNPNYVLGLSGTNAVLVSRTPGDASQQWEFRWAKDSQNVMLGTLYNRGNQQYLTGGNPWSWQPIFTQGMPDGGPTGMMQWYIQPTSPPTGQLLSIQSVGAGNSPPMVVNIDGGSLAPGADTILYQAQPNAANAIWKYTPDGFLLSTLNPGLALSLNVNGGTGANGVATYPKQPIDNSFQQWSFCLVDPKAGTYLIVNQQNMQALSLTGTSNGNSLRTAPPDATNTWQLWTVSPTYPLGVLLAQPAMGYPAFTGSEATAYSYLNTVLGLTALGTDLRSQYANLAAPLSGYQSRINTIATAVVLQHSSKDKNPPSDLPDIDAMVTMVGQLSEELMAAQAVQQLFQQLTMFHTELATVATNATAEVIADAEIDTQSPQQVQISSASIFEGLIYTALSAGSMLTEFGGAAKVIGLTLPVIANLYQTGVSTASSYKQSQTQDAKKEQDEEILYDFLGEVSQVQQFLVDSFNAIGNALAMAESIILGDSFKTRATAAMTAIPSGGNSLFWPPEQGPLLITRLLPGYEIGVLQALLPTRYQLYTGTWIDAPSLASYDNIPPQNAPSYCVWSETINQGLNGYTTHWLAGIDAKNGMSGYPGQATMNLLWSNNVRPFNFYRQQAGWGGFSSQEMWLGDNQTILMFRNYTNSALTIGLQGGDYYTFGLNGPTVTSLNLPPYGYQSVVIFSDKGSKPSAEVTVTTSDGTTVWYTKSAGYDTCTPVTCSNGFATYPYNSANAPALFNSSSSTGSGGCDIGIAMAQS